MMKSLLCAFLLLINLNVVFGVPLMVPNDPDTLAEYEANGAFADNFPSDELEALMVDRLFQEELMAEGQPSGAFGSNLITVDIPGSLVKSVQSFGNLFSRFFGYGYQRTL